MSLQKNYLANIITLAGLTALTLTPTSWAASSVIQNPGFESRFDKWTEVDPAAISSVERSGSKSAKISGNGGRLSQAINVEKNTNYILKAYVKGSGTVGVSVGGKDSKKSISNSSNWSKAEVAFNTGNQSNITIYAAYSGGTGRFDDFSLIKGSSTDSSGSSASCSGNQSLAISNASDNGTNDGNGPSNAIDNKTSTRWSSKGAGKTLTLDMGELVTVKQVGVQWYKGSSRAAYFDLQTSLNNSNWKTVLAGGRSNRSSSEEKYSVTSTEARYVRLIGNSNTSNAWNSVLEVNVYGCTTGTSTNDSDNNDQNDNQDNDSSDNSNSGGLDPSKPPSGNFELIDWNISVPIDQDNNGKADTIKEVPLSKGYTDSRFFYTAADGGMVFKVPVKGAKTSQNTSYTRTELREMLRRGDTSIKTQGITKNNWVFGSAPSSDRKNAGGVDGKLTGTLAVNHVTTTGSESQVGRVIFAQIHANDDEPIRFYYRKLPNNDKGSIYFAHESRNKSNDDYYELIGSRSKSQSNPSDGIRLGEKFSYEIKVTGNTLDVKLFRAGKPTIDETVVMDNSGYDSGGQYMYFKAGAYLQDNTGNDSDYAKVTYYALDNSH